MRSAVLPLADFSAASSAGTGGFQPARLTSIRLLFDRTVMGALILDDVGVSPTIVPAYLANSVRSP